MSETETPVIIILDPVEGPLTESQATLLAKIKALTEDIIGRLQRKGKGRIFVQESLGK